MRVIKLSKTLGRTINVGNFNNVRVEASADAELFEGDSIETADKVLYDVVTKMIKDDLARIKKAREEAEAE